MAKDEKKEDAPAKGKATEEKPKAEKKPAAKKAPAKKKPAAKKTATKKEEAATEDEAKAEKPKKKADPKKKAAPKKKATPKKEEKAEEPAPEPAPEVTPEPEPAPEPEPTPEPEPAPEAEPEEEAEEKPKKKPSKKKEEAVEGEVVETIDEKTDMKVSYTVKPLFGKYSFSGVVVPNPGLQRYINIEPVSIPHTGARHANRPFAKMHMNIVERLINGMMRTEHGTGQKAKMYRVVEEAFDIVAKRTKENPIQVYIDALCNGAPKEEVTRLRYGGINVPKAVDVSASRRLDISLRNICRGAVNASHKSRKRLQDTLANELILASKKDINSFSVSKKEELERVAASAR